MVSQVSDSHSVHRGEVGGYQWYQVPSGGYVHGGGYVWGISRGRGWVPTPGYSHLVTFTTCTIGKRAVHILLECFLVLTFVRQLWVT